MTPRARFAIASTTKPFAAALVLDLVERGKLSLNTRLSRFYPRLPSARRITVRMLLNHTSGLNEYFDDPAINKTIADDPDHHWTRKEVLDAITRTQFTPGSSYAYSNSAYVVLGGVIEKVTRGSVERAFRARIARPLRLARSTFAYRPERSGLFAHPYLRQGGQLHDAFAPGVGVPSDYWGPVWTDGGLASTAPDVARFGDALFEWVLLRPRTVRTMTRLNRFGQGLSVHPQSYGGRTWLGHNGRYGGYETELWHDATRGLTTAVMTNSSGSSAATWRGLVAAYDRVAPDGRPCFGSRTRVTVKLAARRIPAKGPLKLRVVNANDFGITGELSGKRRRVKLKAKAFSVTPHAKKTVKLKLPRALRRLLKRKHKLELRLTAKVKDPTGQPRGVKKRVTPKLKK